MKNALGLRYIAIHMSIHPCHSKRCEHSFCLFFSQRFASQGKLHHRSSSLRVDIHTDIDRYFISFYINVYFLRKRESEDSQMRIDGEKEREREIHVHLYAVVAERDLRYFFVSLLFLFCLLQISSYHVIILPYLKMGEEDRPSPTCWRCIERS